MDDIFVIYVCFYYLFFVDNDVHLFGMFTSK